MSISAHGIQISSLLDSSSGVILLQQLYFEHHLLPKIKLASGEKAEAHTLFRLMVTSDGQLPIKMYTELDITLLGLKVSNIDMLIMEDPKQVLDRKHQTKLPAIVGWNLIQLSYNAVVTKYGTSRFGAFKCQEGVNPLLFSQLCIYYHSDICEGHTLRVATKVVFNQSQQLGPPRTDDLSKKDLQNFINKQTDRTGHRRIKEKMLFASLGILSSLILDVLVKYL